MALPPLYIDEDSCGRRLIAALRRSGCDVLTAEEAKTRSWSDERQLEFAADVGRVLVSANVGDFAGLQQSWGASGRDHAGIIIWKRSRWSPELFAERLASLPNDVCNALATSILYF